MDWLKEVRRKVMDLKWQEIEDIPVVKVPKELDITISDRFKSCVVEELLKKKKSKIVLDFSSCEYIDSSGLGVVISIYKRSMMEGGTTILAGLNEDVKRVLSITGLNRVLKVKDTVEEAVEEAKS
ncbi:MAG: STAS domain-containing protein [Thermotogae bacterium]|nr:STAS domain-containing protein [Thermotogota bacterium]